MTSLHGSTANPVVRVHERGGRSGAVVPGLVLILGAVFVAGCDDVGAGPPVASVRDSAGVTIAENRVPDSAAVTWWRVEPPPLVDIGGADADESESLFRVGGALRLPDGRIVVSNGGSAEVRWFGADGRLIHTSGRRGDGPGEFQRPARIVHLPGDSVLVAEAVGGRMTVLDPAGEYVRDVTLGGAGAAALSLVGRLADGRLIARTSELSGIGDLSEGMIRPNVVLLAVTPDGERIDTVVVAPGAERFLNINQSGGQIRSVEIGTPPFRRSPTYAAAGDEVIVATQDAPEIRVYSAADGRLVRIIRTGAEIRPVTSEHLDAWIERQTANAPAERRQAIREGLSNLPAGEFIPPYGEIGVDDLGYLWVADYDDRIRPAGAWSIYGPDGRLAARIRLPDGMQPYQAGEDFIVGLERDELDVEHLRVYRLIRAESTTGT